MKSVYPSRYSNGKSVTAAQYITELICEKKATLAGGELPQKFWEQPKWKSFFRQQIMIANSLLKIYEPTSVIRALQSFEAKKIYSLSAPFLDPIIRAEQSKIEVQAQKLKETPQIVKADVTVKPRQHIVKSNQLSKLRELDGEEESK